VQEFRLLTGFGKKASVEVVVDDSDTARALQPIVDVMRMADAGAVVKFHLVLQHAMLQGGGNASDALDCISAACEHQWRQEGLPELEVSRKALHPALS
jgi:hypothetical protein